MCSPGLKRMAQAGPWFWAEGRLEALSERYGIDEFSILGHTTGATLAGIQCEAPWDERIVPVITGEHVTLEAGTGAVTRRPPMVLKILMRPKHSILNY